MAVIFLLLFFANFFCGVDKAMRHSGDSFRPDK